jgi:hypothetical protein
MDPLDQHVMREDEIAEHSRIVEEAPRRRMRGERADEGKEVGFFQRSDRRRVIPDAFPRAEE